MVPMYELCCRLGRFAAASYDDAVRLRRALRVGGYIRRVELATSLRRVG